MSREKVSSPGKRINWNIEESRRAGHFLPAVDPGVDQTGNFTEFKKPKGLVIINRNHEVREIEPYEP